MSLGSSPFDDLAKSFLGAQRSGAAGAASASASTGNTGSAAAGWNGNGKDNGSGAAVPDFDPRGARILAMAICGNLPGIAGIWLVQYADRLARQCGPVGLLTHDGVHYSGQVLQASGRAMPTEEAGWMAHASRFVRRWIIAAPEGTRAEDIVGVREADIVLLTGADEAAAAAARLKLVELAEAARSKGLRPRTVSVVVLGAKDTVARALVTRLEDYADRELDMLVAPGGAMQRIDRIESTGPVTLPGLGRRPASEVANLILEPERVGEDEFGGFHHFDQTAAVAQPKTTPGRVPGMAQFQAQDPLDGFLADTMATTAPSMSTAPEPTPRRAPTEEVAAGAAARPSRPATAAPPSQPAGGGHSASGPGSAASLASLFDDLVLLAPRAAGAKAVELAADLGGRLHLLSTDQSTRDLRIASAWVGRNWLLLATACRELRGGARAVVVEHLFVDNAPDAVPLHGCGLRLHLRVRTASGTTRIDLNDEGTAQAE